jgi:hypothetical protein
MAKFSTHLSLGQTAWGVNATSYYRAEFEIIPVTVGQIRVEETHPSYNRNAGIDSLFKEEYMCVETGIGSGRVWQYNKYIFSTKEEAEAGLVKLQQEAWEVIKARDKADKEFRERQQEEELARLDYLTRKYKDIL